MSNSKVQLATARNSRARFSIATIVALSLALAGCGGGDEAPPPPASSQQGGSSLADLACAIAAIFSPDSCGYSGSSGYGSAPPTTTVTPTPSSTPPDWVDLGPRVAVASYDVEPNDELANASVLNFVQITFASPDVKLETTGLLRGRDMELGRKDVVDTYIFTSPRPLDLFVQLCNVHDQARCDQMTRDDSYPIGGVYFEVLDQFGNLLASTEEQLDVGNLLSISVAGGVPYYIKVIATPQMTWLTEYYLRAFSVGSNAALPTDEYMNVAGANVASAPELWVAEDAELTVTLSWMPPTTYTDGSALVGLQGYALYYADQVSEGPLEPEFSISLDAGLSSYVLTLPRWGAWYIAIAAIDSNGIEGVLSDVVVTGGPPPLTP